jgi:hypothetical protein
LGLHKRFLHIMQTKPRKRATSIIAVPPEKARAIILAQLREMIAEREAELGEPLAILEDRKPGGVVVIALMRCRLLPFPLPPTMRVLPREVGVEGKGAANG